MKKKVVIGQNAGMLEEFGKIQINKSRSEKEKKKVQPVPNAKRSKAK